MKRVPIAVMVSAVFAGGIAIGQQAGEDDAAEAVLADARLLIKVTGGDKMAIQVMNQMLASFKQAMPQVPGEYWDKFMEKVDAQGIVELTAPIYVKYLTHAEIKGLVAFYQSPLGKKLVEVQPKIVQESFAVGQQWGMKIAQQVQRELIKEGYIKGQGGS